MIEYLEGMIGYSFSKKQKRWLLAALCVILPAAGFLLFTFRTQISDLMVYGQRLLANIDGTLLIIIAVAGNIFSGVLFLAMRKRISKECPSCGKYQSMRAHYCMHCGTELPKKRTDRAEIIEE